MSERIRTESSVSNDNDNDDFVVVQRCDSDDSSSEHPDPNNDSSNESSPVEEPEKTEAAVEFLNVQRVYPTDQDIRIRCAMTKSFRFSEMDSIGLYRLGWSDPSEAVASEYVQHVQRVDQFFTTLKTCFLPTNPNYDEYYQFCYVLHDSKTVKGASPPFHLIRSIRGGGEGTILPPATRIEGSSVRTSDSPSTSFVAVEKPGRSAENIDTCSKCTELNSYKNRLDAALQSKALATSELVALQERYEHLNNVFEAQTVEARKIKRRLDELERKFQILTSENDQQTKTMTEIMHSLTQKTEELEEVKSKLNEVSIERDNIVAQLLVLQGDHDKMSIENESLTQQISILNNEMNDISVQLADKENWISSISSEIDRLTKENKEMNDENQRLKDEIKDKEMAFNDISGDHDKVIQEMKQQLTLVAQENEDRGNELAASRVEVQNLEKELNANVDHTDALERQLCDLKASETSWKQRHDNLTEQTDRIWAIVESFMPTHGDDLKEVITKILDEQISLQEETSLLKAKVEDISAHFEDQAAENTLLRDEIRSLKAETSRLQLANENASSRSQEGAQGDVKDVDVLVQYLPSLTRLLLNISNAGPANTQDVIKELKDMIRFLLTSHEHMKAEIAKLRRNQST